MNSKEDLTPCIRIPQTKNRNFGNFGIIYVCVCVVHPDDDGGRMAYQLNRPQPCGMNDQTKNWKRNNKKFAFGADVLTHTSFYYFINCLRMRVQIYLKFIHSTHTIIVTLFETSNNVGLQYKDDCVHTYHWALCDVEYLLQWMMRVIRSIVTFWKQSRVGESINRTLVIQLRLNTLIMLLPDSTCFKFTRNTLIWNWIVRISF